MMKIIIIIIIIDCSIAFISWSWYELVQTVTLLTFLKEFNQSIATKSRSDLVLK